MANPREAIPMASASSPSPTSLSPPQIPMELHEINRANLIKSLQEHLSSSSRPLQAFVFLQGGEEQTRHCTDHAELFRQESYFAYLFGVREPGFYGAIDVATGESILFAPRLPAEYAVWLGEIKPLSFFKERYMVSMVFYTDDIAKVLHDRFQGSGKPMLFLLHGLNTDSNKYSKPADFEGIEKFKTDLNTLHPILTECRVFKSDMELALIQFANDISSEAHVEVMRKTKVGMKEYQLESMFLHHTYMYGGCRHCSYTCICATGDNSSVLHYGHAAAPNDKLIWILNINNVSHLLLQIDDERGPLKCHNHSSKILSWPWWLVENNTRFKAIIEQSGLSQLARCTYRFVNKLLISSFVERWQPETNTFHMTVGEMTLTLDDVGTILGLPIVGKSVSIPDVTDHHGVTLLVYGLGVTEGAAYEEVSSAGGNSVRLEWLRSQFAGVTDSDPEEAIQRAARAYLLFLLGCTLFSDKSGGRVPVVYLGLLMDLGSIHTYAWGAATLAFLYRQLGFASRSGVRQMGGYMTLLEAWIYEHFRAFRPHQNMGYNEDMPHVYHWASRREAGSSIDHLKSFRAQLDSLVATDVIWDPYHSCRDRHPCNPVTFYHGCLKCLDVVEPYHPDRVLRQFGRVQTIPDAPLAPSCGARGNISARYTVMYRYLDRIWEAWDNHVLSEQRRSIPVRQPWQCVPGYMDWYKNITHLYVERTDEPRVHHHQDFSEHADRIAHALQISHPIIDAGYQEGIRHPYRLYQAIESMTHVLEGQHIDEAGPSSARGRFPSSTLTYSRRPRRRHAADS